MRTRSWEKTEQAKEWRRVWGRAWYQKNKEKMQLKGIRRRRKQRAWLLVDAARRRARLLGIPYDLDGRQMDLQRRIDAGRCELTGVPFNLDGGRTFDSPSLDRINPKKGYIYDNIRVVCDLVNRALSNWGEEPFRIVAEAYLSRPKPPSSSKQP